MYSETTVYLMLEEAWELTVTLTPERNPDEVDYDIDYNPSEDLPYWDVEELAIDYANEVANGATAPVTVKFSDGSNHTLSVHPTR